MASEVKGTWFVTLQGWAERELPDGVETLARHMPSSAALVRAPQQRQWYPEAALHEVFEALWTHVDGDEARFIDYSTSVSKDGVGRFFRVLLGLTSPSFLLRQVPTMWSRLRRGDTARVGVRKTPEGLIVEYADFPCLQHPPYLAFTRGSLCALAQVADTDAGRVEVLGHGPDHASLLVHHA